MADVKITALTAISANPVNPATFPMPMVDLLDTSMAASGSTRKVTVNQILGAGGTATLASATITGAATVGTTLGVTGATTLAAASVSGDLTVATNKLKVTGGNVGIGTATPTNYANYTTLTINGTNGGEIDLTDGGTLRGQLFSESTGLTLAAVGGLIKFGAGTGGTEKMRLDSSGNVGVGVTPSAWATVVPAIQIGTAGGFIAAQGSAEVFRIGSNAFYDGSFKYVINGFSSRYDQASGTHSWFTAPSGTAGNAITFTQAMTLTASGELIIGATSGGGGRLWIQSAGSTENVESARITASNTFNTLIAYVVQAEGYNAGATALKIGRNSTTLRSINAGGTVNASGADYAEYMTKASDFVLAKGAVAGIDANGKLTNVFADAVSFVVKSTDPSYVGNDKWGVDLEGDALEAARQLVDRVAFAGQVPVNVTGAKAGDYIVPVVNGTGIKGQAVSNPTFEQYQLAVGKVISIDADGRARIIVKVA